MKIIFLIFLAISVLNSCSNSNYSRNYEKYEKVVKEDGTKDENGFKQGVWIKYNSLGDPITKSTYLNDTLHGLAESYHRDGKLYTKCKYFKGELIDTFLIYYENGQLNSYARRDSNGLSQGEFRIYHVNGQIHQIGEYKDGRLFGSVKEYYDNGNLRSIENYNDLGHNGVAIYLNEIGDTLKRIKYQNDTIIEQYVY